MKRNSHFSIEDANLFLSASGKGYLTKEEEVFLFNKKETISYDKQPFLIDPSGNLNNLADYFYDLIDEAYEKIYEGYPYAVYSNMGKLIKFIYRYKLQLRKKFLDLIAKNSLWSCHRVTTKGKV